MRRWLEKPWLLACLALAIHLSVVAAMKLFVPRPVYAFGWHQSAPAATALTVPVVEPLKPADPPPEMELDRFGEKTREGDSVASLDLPGQMQSETPHDFEQAWLRQQPVLATPSQPQESSKKSSALVPSGIQEELPVMNPKQIEKGNSPTPTPPENRPRENEARDGRATQGENGDDQKTNTEPETSKGEINPAPQGVSDVDPFAKVEGVSLVGGVKARQGREIKFTRPRVDLAFRAEFTRLAKRRMEVMFRITTDSSGRPRNVEILKSSGSEQIDESLRLALFDSWFGGKMPDEFPFAVRFYDD